MTNEVQKSTSAAAGNEGTHIQGEATPLMEEALAQGWVPKEEYQGDEERWVDYAEFVRRGELFRKIESQSKEIKEFKRALKELATHNVKIREVEYQRALDALKAEKKQALNEGEMDKVVEIDDRLDLVKEQQRQLQQQQQFQDVVEPAVHPELQSWMGQNSWYEANRAMRGWADARGAELAGEGLAPQEVLKTLTKEVKTRFPEKFSNPNRERPSAVEGAPRRSAKGSEAAFELNDVERQIMKRVVDTGVISESDYIAQLKALKNA